MAVRKGGIAELRSRLPEIIKELPIRSQEVAMQIAKQTADGANTLAAGQYEGSFNVEAREVDGTAGEFRGGSQREGMFISGWALTDEGPGAHILKGKAAGIFADWYWFFGEFGTVHESAKPFMIPAYRLALAGIGPKSRVAFAGL